MGAVSWIALAVAVAALAVAAIEAWLLIGLLPHQGRLLLRLEALETALGQGRVHGLPVGEKAPDFELRDLAGRHVTLASLRSSERPVLLFFTNPHCGPCDELLPKVGHWQQQHGDRLQIAVISRDSVEVNRAKAARHGLRTVLLQRKREVVAAYQVESTPAAVLVDAGGRVASQLAYGPGGIEELVERGRIGAVNGGDQTGESAALTPGQPAPHLVLPDLDGNTTSLSELRGTSTLVLFWNPDCGFCRQLLPELKAWEHARPDESPRLLVVSRGDAEVNRVMGLRSPVVLDGDGSAMRAFGVSGTPMGVLVDTSGRIASSVAAGAQQVMALAIARSSQVRA